MFLEVCMSVFSNCIFLITPMIETEGSEKSTGRVRRFACFSLSRQTLDAIRYTHV